MDHLLIIYYPADQDHFYDTAGNDHHNERQSKPWKSLLVQKLWNEQVISNIDEQGQIDHLDGSDCKCGAFRTIVLKAQKIPDTKDQHPE
jgi:hypothetical protein